MSKVIETTLFIPKQGDVDDLFERLNEYISQFDPDWGKKIKGASEERIEKLYTLSRRYEMDFSFPKEYLVYLRTMGEDDGGLLHDFTMANTDLNTLLNFYEEVGEHPEEYNFCPEHFAFGYNVEVSTTLYMNIINNSEYSIEREVTEDPKNLEENWFSSSLEKLLFQSVVIKYIQQINLQKTEYVARKKSICDAMGNVIPKKIFAGIDNLLQEYGYKKMWISDEWNLIAVNQKSVLFLKIDYTLYGYLWSNEKDYAGIIITKLEQIYE